MEKVTSSIESLENQAEKSLDEARVKAAEILKNSTEESQNILNSGLEVEDIRKECETIIEKAHSESEEKIQSSKIEAESLKSAASQKVEDIVKRLTALITEA